MGALRGGFVIVTFLQRVVVVFHYTPLLPLLLPLPQVFLWDLAVRCFTQYALAKYSVGLVWYPLPCGSVLATLQPRVPDP